MKSRSLAFTLIGAAGGHRDHCDPGQPNPAGVVASQTLGPLGCLQEQSEAMGFGNPYSVELGLGGDLLNPVLMDEPENIRLIRESEVRVPSEMIAIGDAVMESLLGGESRYVYPDLFPQSVMTQADLGLYDYDDLTDEDLSFFRRAVKRRHGGQWNMLFCDGHIESGKTGDWFDTRKEAIRKRWNIDNLPHWELFP